jgi:hypothetical protein
VDPRTQLAGEREWLVALLEAVAHKVLLKSSWGYKIRIYLALGLTCVAPPLPRERSERKNELAAAARQQTQQARGQNGRKGGRARQQATPTEGRKERTSAATTFRSHANKFLFLLSLGRAVHQPFFCARTPTSSFSCSRFGRTARQRPPLAL